MRERFTRTIRSRFLAAALATIAALLAGRGSQGDPVSLPPGTGDRLSHTVLVVSGAVSDGNLLPPAHDLPPIVFVLRTPATPTTPTPVQFPGFGPGGRLLSPGGQLMLRERNGRLRSIVGDSTLFDVSDPAVSWDARRIAFAGVEHRGDPWRLYLVNADGSGLRPITRSDRALDLGPLGSTASETFARYDDFDPCWLPDGRIVFASTRFPQLSQEGRLPVSNLFVVNADGRGLERLTAERNGAEEPMIDRTGRIVYARWLFNPYLPSDASASGLTPDRAAAVQADTVDHWQLVSIFPDGDRIQLAAGQLGTRVRAGAYQPCMLPDGTIAGVEPDRASILPAARTTSLVAFGPILGNAPARIGPAGGIAISPAALPDGRILFSYSPMRSIERGADGIPIFTEVPFELRALTPGGARSQELVLSVNGADVLDAVPLTKRKVPPVIGPQGGIDDPAWTLPVTRLDQVRRGHDTFRFDDLNVFATGPVDSPFPDAPKIANKVRIRFFAALARPEAATGDTVVLVREAKLEDSGAVHESDIPGDVPMFEQLVDDLGHVLRSSRGPAHVPGFNFARTGSGTKCIGCHAGHSALPVPRNYLEAKWFNASTSADVAVSGGSDGALLVDRRAKGPIRGTGWVAGSEGEPWARLKWAIPIEAKALVLYAPTPDGAAGTDLQVRGCDVILLRDGREVGHALAGRVRPQGTRIEFPPVRIDAVELRRFRVQGSVERRPAVALAEIETIARMIE
jgi:hypothetical protein